MQRILIVIIACLASWQSIVRADEVDQASHFFTQLYTKTCVKHADQMQNLVDNFSAIETKQLSRGKAAFFLQNQPGKVWVIPNLVGDYLVSIEPGGRCSVYTHNVNINKIEQNFIRLLEKTPSSYRLQKIQDETLPTPLGPAHFIRYIRTNIADNSSQAFMLQTTNAQGAEIQAQAVVEPVIFAQ